jgi:hypothetical protein
MLTLLLGCPPKTPPVVAEPECQIIDHLAIAIPDEDERAMVAILGGMSHIEFIDCPTEGFPLDGLPEGPWKSFSMSLETHRDWVHQVLLLTPESDDVDLKQTAADFIGNGFEEESYSSTHWLPMEAPVPAWWQLEEETEGSFYWWQTPELRNCSVYEWAEGRMAFTDGEQLWLMMWSEQWVGPVPPPGADCVP